MIYERIYIELYLFIISRTFFFVYRKVDDDRSVFLSNLLFTVDETLIRLMFQEV